jgi:hypothetical protein
MSIFAKVFGWLKGPATEHVVEDAAITAEQRQLLVKTSALQRRVDTKVTHAQAHLGAARNAFAHQDGELTGIERAITDARDQISARGNPGSVDESFYRADGLWVDPRVPKSTRDALKEMGVHATRMFDRLPYGVSAGHLKDAERLLKEARDTASEARGLNVDTSNIHAAREELQHLNTILSDLDFRARMAHGDIFGYHAAWDRRLPDGSVVRQNARFQYPY